MTLTITPPDPERVRVLPAGWHYVGDRMHKGKAMPNPRTITRKRPALNRPQSDPAYQLRLWAEAMGVTFEEAKRRVLAGYVDCGDGWKPPRKLRLDGTR